MTMTLQKPPGGIEWTRIRVLLPDGTWVILPGYTWNPVTGCMHRCRWPKSDGSMEICYAEKIANGIAKKSFPQGFEHHYFHENRLDDPIKKKDPAGIFTVSMGDLFGSQVPQKDIEAVLDVMRKASWHIFQALTKYPGRLEQFEFPDNCWAGISSPSGNHRNQSKGKRTLWHYLISLTKVKALVRFFSVEPIWFDAAEVFRSYLYEYGSVPFNWIITGAMSSGEQPQPEWIHNLVNFCDENSIPIFFKGNLKWDDWRSDFPQPRLIKPREQLKLL